MNEALEQIRSLLEKADEALSRQGQRSRTAKQRDEDFDQALRAHRQAVAMLSLLQAQPHVDDAFVAAVAPLQVEATDLEIMISEIRFDENERTERLPRLRHADG
jgi:DNA transposition AAA+ family ATPase